MSFVDPAFFLLFLPLALAVFYAAGRWGGASLAALVYGLASVVFCLPFGWRFEALTLGSMVVNGLICGGLLSASAGPEQRRWLLRLGVTIDLVVLGLFKYVPAFAAIPAIGAIAPILLAWVPITISFTTFQRLVLLVDCYRRDPAAVALFGQGRAGAVRFFAFAMGFANLLIGPIAFAAELGPQLRSRRFGRLHLIDIAVGVTLLAIGLFKKLVIADTLGIGLVDPVFTAIAAHHAVLGVDAGAAIPAYYLQLYFDFSGYSDMALGVARLFGLRLPFNFNSPLRATGIADFYRRWHITLTRIVARFLFQALSLKGTRLARRRKWKGLRRGLCELWLPLAVNFLVIGLWHGAAWTFAVFGLIHGAWYILETEVRRRRFFRNWSMLASDRLRTVLGQAVTIVPLTLTFALFRSASLGDYRRLLIAVVRRLPPSAVPGATSGVHAAQWAELGGAFAIVWLMPNAMELLSRYRPGIVTFPVPSHTPRWFAFRWRPDWLWGVFVAALMAGVLRVCGYSAPFVYGGF
jgi:D-alanyl-lipoteichoic acid acyltransferase DltB (MBOAT superfamily)